MAARSALPRTLDLARLRDDDVTWRLLRADNAHLIVGILGAHLGGEQRRLDAADLYERVDADLDQLRDYGLELPRNGQGYCSDWRSAGFLVRRPTADARGETFELSAGALAAIRTLDALAAPRQAATESRLAAIAAQLGQLALDTDPDATRRLEQLHARRDEIDAEIERVHAGDIDPLDDPRALERIRDILMQSEEMPSDFARVRAQFEELNRMLRQRILESDDSQKHVLDEVFRGVDLIAESDAGRSFAGFSALILDPALGASFDDNIDRILDRGFAGKLSADQRRFLRRLILTLKSNSAEIQEVVTNFARGLRRYVQSQEYQRDRVLRDLLRQALASGVAAAKHTKPYLDTSVTLELSAVRMASVGGVRLFNPAEFDASAPIATNVSETVDLEALRALARDTEIDFDELIQNTNALLAETEHCTVGDVLARFPASQGVASVVGLLALAAVQGVRAEGHERVRWVGGDHTGRFADIPIHTFTGRIN
jgi:hypothetical protein